MKRISGAVASVILAGSLTAVAASRVVADQASLDALKEHCAASLNVGPENCACIAEMAGKELNDNQQALAAAMLSKDQAAADSARSRMPVQEVTGAAMFMVSAPQRCASQ